MVTLATEISGITVYSLKVEVPMKWKTVCPLQENRDDPSGITPRPWVDLSGEGGEDGERGEGGEKRGHTLL